jgi:CRP/FNR family cyclic AMP-dependent transcriptional regulator
MDRAHLKQVPFFEGLDRRELGAVGRQADELDVAAGKVLAREGEFGQEFFVIESGTAEVTRGGEPVATLGPGEFFGEIALLEDDARRTATVTAATPMVLIVLTRASFRALDREHPKLHARVSAAIDARRGGDAERAVSH